MQAMGIVGSILPMIICAVLSLIGLEIIPVAKGKIKNGKRIALLYVAATSLFFLSIIVSIIGGKIVGGGIGNRPGSSDKDDVYYGSSVYYDKEGKRAGNAIEVYENATINGNFEYVKETGDKVWFEFKPEYTGTYVFTHTSQQPASISVNKPKNKVLYEDSYGTVFAQLESGKKYFIVVEMTDGSDCEFAFHVARPNDETIWDNNSKYVYFSSGEYEKWFAFIPEKTGYYEFQISGADNYAHAGESNVKPTSSKVFVNGTTVADTVEIKVGDWQNVQFGTFVYALAGQRNGVTLYEGTTPIASSTNLSDGIQASVTAGTTYYLRLMRSNTNSYDEMDLNVWHNQKLSAPSAHLGNNFVSQNYDSTEAFFKFKPKDDGYYVISHNSNEEIYFNVEKTSVSEGYSVDSQWIERNDYFIIGDQPLSSTETYSIGINNVFESFDFTIAKINDVDINGDGTPFSIDTKNPHGVWFRIAPTTSGLYAINHTSSTSLTIKLYNTDVPSDKNEIQTYTGSINDTPMSVNLSSGNVYYAYVTTTNGEESVYNAELTVGKDITTIENNSSVSGYLSNYEKWYKFTPTESDVYSFQLSGSGTYSSWYLTLYDKDENEINSVSDSYSYNCRIAEYLVAGETYYVRAYYPSNSTASVTLYVNQAIELTEGNEAYVYASNSAQHSWLKFTPTETKEYSFSHDYSYSLNFRVYELDTNNDFVTVASSSGNYNSILAKQTYDEGKTYYIEVYSDGTSTYSYNIIVDEAPQNTYPVLVPGNSYTATVTYNSYAYFEFTPTESGTYTFYSTGNSDTYITVYNSNMSSIGSNDDGGNNTNFSISLNLVAGQTYIFEARYLNTSSTGSFTVYFKKGY